VHRRTAFRLLLALSSACATFGAVELAVRSARGAPASTAFRFEQIGGSLVDDAGRYELHPRRFFALAAPYRGVCGHPGRYAIDAWSFRGRPLASAPPGALRVGVFGDSCVYGASVDAADMIGEQVAVALRERGLPPTQVVVASFGVPGYSTVQIGALVDEALARWQLDLVVIYPAAWNDQAPAMGANDLALRERAQRVPRIWERSSTYALLLELAARAPAHSRKEILDGWRRGEPPYGTRVPATSVEGEVRAMLAAARRAGAAVLCVAPAHPAATRRDHPRVVEDAESVRRATRGEHLELLDAAALFAATPRAEASLFCDFVHPSPDGSRLLGRAIAESIAPELARLRAARPPAPELDLELARCIPAESSCFGGARLEIELRGAASFAAPPLLLVGGAQLLDLELAPDGRTLRGTMPAQRPGTYDLLVQSAAGCSVLPAAITITAPRLEIEPGLPWKIRLLSRPGDIANLRVSKHRLEFPAWSEIGACELDPRLALPGLVPMVVGPNGIGELEFPPPAQAGDGPHFLQAEVVARTPSGGILASRWTPVLEVRAPRAR
jgi:lysophospholipase L1-like esterase